MKFQAMLFFAPFLVFHAWGQEPSPESRIITVSTTGQPPYKNPGVMTLGTLTIEQTINFAVTATSATASGGKGGALSYAWDWGDGTPLGSGANPTHVYVVPGTYTVTVTISEAGNPTPTVLTLPVTITDAIKSLKLQTNEDWSRTGHDSLLLTGVIRIPANTSARGQTLAFDISGVQVNFTLDDLGAGVAASSTDVFTVVSSVLTSNGNTVPTATASSEVVTSHATVKLFIRHRPPGTPFVDAPFQLNVVNGHFADAYASLGISNRNAVRENVRVTVKLTAFSALYQTSVNQLFTSKKGGKGKTR